MSTHENLEMKAIYEGEEEVAQTASKYLKSRGIRSTITLAEARPRTPPATKGLFDDDPVTTPITVRIEYISPLVKVEESYLHPRVHRWFPGGLRLRAGRERQQPR